MMASMLEILVEATVLIVVNVRRPVDKNHIPIAEAMPIIIFVLLVI